MGLVAYDEVKASTKTVRKVGSDGLSRLILLRVFVLVPLRDCRETMALLKSIVGSKYH